MAPKVTVVMAVYNGERYLREATESILAQTLTDYEFVVVDDGSTDASAEIVASYTDARIRLIRSPRNCGLAAALNSAFASATGQYIARMDADDISARDRLARQVEFMETHPLIGISGTWVEVVGKGRREIVRHPIEPDVIQSRLLFEAVLAHPSVIINRRLWQLARLSYDPSFPCAQDFDLWVRAARAFSLGNQAEVLLVHRLHDEQVGARLAMAQTTWAKKVRLFQLRQLGLEPESQELETHEALSTWTWPSTPEFAADAEAWLRRVQAANQLSRNYPEPTFSRVLGERWLAVCQSIEADPRARFWTSPLSRRVDMGWKENWRGRIWRGLSRVGSICGKCA